MTMVGVAQSAERRLVEPDVAGSYPVAYPNLSHLVYMTTNVKNGMIYIGSHSTRDVDDGYIGS